MQVLRNAAAGNAYAIQAILVYFKEQTLSPQEQESVLIYLRQAGRQSHHAIYLQALLYDNGYGVKKDLDMAFLLMREASSKGNAKATYEVGHRFLEGKGVEQNYDNALQWLEIAAGSPHYEADAMNDLGHMHEQGLSVPIDSHVAQIWYEKAARKGHKEEKS